VFREIKDETTVHDLRLRGGPRCATRSTPPSMTTGASLIETKDYDEVLDLPVVRNC
jgi:hypothetical protein